MNSSYYKLEQITNAKILADEKYKNFMKPDQLSTNNDKIVKRQPD